MSFENIIKDIGPINVIWWHNPYRVLKDIHRIKVPYVHCEENPQWPLEIFHHIESEFFLCPFVTTLCELVSGAKNFLVTNTSNSSHHGCGKVTPSKIKMVSWTWWFKKWTRNLWCLFVFRTHLSTGKNNKLQCLWEVDLIFSWFYHQMSWVLYLYWLTMMNLNMHDQGGLF